MNNPERELIPYEAAELLGERLLVIAPHPDDETIACGGLIARHAAARRAVRVVVVSDGAAGTDGDPQQYATRRQAESREGLRILGASDCRFLGLPDRGLSSNEKLSAALAAELLEFRPDLVCVPSPVEVHPDHVAVARALVDLMQQEARVRNISALTRIAFYEVSQPFRPNTLVDITAEADRKWRAIEAHASQHERLQYVRFARGLNQYRGMTLGDKTEFAEGYWVIAAEELSTLPWGELCRKVGPPVPVEVSANATVSVIVRTRDRAHLLREAVDSIRRNNYAAEIVVVNDGGTSPAALLDSSVKLVDLERNVGRSEAMNRGVAAAGGELIAFLDDDDLYHEDHLATLANRVAREQSTVFYTDAVSTSWRRDAEGKFAAGKRKRTFAQDFDPALLVLDNYIPLPTVMLTRAAYLEAGGFDPEFDLFEDWDFLLRLSRTHKFVRIPRLTCEIRHFEGGDSVILDALSDPARLRDAKGQIWSKHHDLLTPEVLFGVTERQKQRIREAEGYFSELSGRATHLELDVARLQREKHLLLSEIQRQALEHEQEAAQNSAEQARLREEAAALRHEAGALRQEIDSRDDALRHAAAEIERVTDIAHSHDQTIQQLFAEIARLNQTLDTIYASRSWRLRSLVSRLSGK